MENNLKDQHYKNMGIKPQMETLTFEAESIAFVVCAHLGIDASDYSFGYVSSWASGRDLPELHASLSHIQQAATEIIDKLDDIVEKARTRETDSPQITSANDITAAPRRYNADGERLWNGKTADQFSNADVQRFMAETQKLLSQQHSAELAEQRSEGSASKIDTICANAMARAAEINAANIGQFRQQDRDHEIKTQGE